MELKQDTTYNRTKDTGSINRTFMELKLLNIPMWQLFARY